MESLRTESGLGQQRVKIAQGGGAGAREQPGKQHQGQTRQIKEQARDEPGRDHLIRDQQATVRREQFLAGFQNKTLVIQRKFAEDQCRHNQVKGCGGKAVADQGGVHIFQGYVFFEMRLFDFLFGLGQHARRGVNAGDRRAALRHQQGERSRAAADLQDTRPFMRITVCDSLFDALDSAQGKQLNPAVVILWAGFQPLHKHGCHGL